MKRFSPRNARIALRALLLATVVGLTAKTAAETVAFPQAKPAFTVVFPNDWSAHVEGNGTLTARPSYGATVELTVLLLEGVTNEKAARAALPRVTEQIAEATEVTALKKGEIVVYQTEKNLRCLHLESKGRDRAGAEVVLTTIIFSPEEEQYYVLITNATPAAEKAHEAELVGIVQSIDGE